LILEGLYDGSGHVMARVFDQFHWSGNNDGHSSIFKIKNTILFPFIKILLKSILGNSEYFSKILLQSVFSKIKEMFHNLCPNYYFNLIRL